MQFKVPKIVGELKAIKMMAGNIAVVNGVSSGSNKIIIPCRSKDHADEIIEKIKNAKSGEIIYI